LLLPYIDGLTVLELGCLDGKWSQYIVPRAGRSVLVDLDERMKVLLRKRLGTDQFEFYQTSGSELSGIQDNSVDFVFSMDTLVRVRKPLIRRYFREFARVLGSDGKAVVHLPCRDRRDRVSGVFRGCRKLTS